MADSPKKHNSLRRLFSWECLMEFVDKHPRTGWFLSSLMLLNTVINLVTLYIVS